MLGVLRVLEVRMVLGVLAATRSDAREEQCACSNFSVLRRSGHFSRSSAFSWSLKEPRSYVLAGQDIKARAKGVDADGKPYASQWSIRYDGRDQTVSGNPDFDSVSFKRIDAYTTEFTQKKAGKVVSTGTRSFSKDGKIMTIASKGIDAAGKPFDDLSVFERR